MAEDLNSDNREQIQLAVRAGLELGAKADADSSHKLVCLDEQ